MADTRTVGIDIKITTSDSRKEIAKLTKENEKLKDVLNDTTNAGTKGFSNLGSVFSSGSGRGISSSLSGIALAAGAVYASFKVLGELKGVFTDAIKESVEQEDALTKLGQALRSAGSYSEEAVQSFNDFANALEKSSRFEADNILSNVALAKAMGATNDQAKQLVQAAANMSAQFGGSLDDNTEKLAKTLGGTAGKLAQIIPALKGFSEEQLKSGAAVEFINKQFAGSAAAGLDNYSGKINSLSDSYKNFLQAIGDYITKSPITLKLIEETTKIFDRMSLAMTNTDAAYKGTSKSSTEYAAAVEKESQKLQELQDRLTEQVAVKKQLEEQNNSLGNGIDSFLGKAFGYEVATLDKTNQTIESLNRQIDGTLQNIGKLQSSAANNVPSDPNANKPGVGAGVQDQAVLDARKNLYIELADLQNQAAVDQANQENELRLAKSQNDADYRQQELEAELQYQLNKNLIVYENEMAKNELIKNAQNKALADQKAMLTKEQADKKVQADFDKKLAQDKVANQKSTFATIATLSNSNNKTLAAIGKAAAITQIAIETPVAIAKALSAFPPPFNFAAAGLVGAAMAVQAAQIAGVQFADGGEVSRVNGRVGGSNIRGDRTQIYVNGDETVLNHKERRVISDIIADGGGMSGGLAVEVLQSINNKIGVAPAIYIDGTLITKELNRYNNLGLGA